MGSEMCIRDRYSLDDYRVDCSTREMLVLYSPRDNCPRSPRLTSKTTTARPDTPTRTTPQDHGAARDRPRGKAAGVQRVLHGEGSPQIHEASTHTRADKKLGRVFVDLSGPKVVVSWEETVHSHRARRFFTVYVGVFSCATSRTPRKCSSSSSRILVQTVSLPRW